MSKLKQILNELEIPINSFKKYDMDTIKKHYRYLIRKYHPDNCSDEEKKYNTYKMSSINKAMDSLKELIDNKEIIIKEKSEIKKDFSVIELMDKLNKLKLLVKNKQKQINNINKIKSINDSLNYLQEIKERISIYIERGETYDYWDFINYIDLLYYYYEETINIDIEYKFNSNIEYKFNDYLKNEKETLCSLHRKMLYVKINELVKLFKELGQIDNNYNKYDKNCNEIIEYIEKSDEEIQNIKWYLELNNIDKNKLKGRISKIGR